MEGGRAERRLAAILAADIVGYSRLVGADEEGTLARLRALRSELINPATVAHRGRVVKTSGDGFLLEFASVVDAVRCGIEVQRGMVLRNSDVHVDERLELRIGINLGDVVVEGDDLLGDGVNVAARLEALATPGGICISAAVYDQIRDKVPGVFGDLGEHTFKNILRPVHTYFLQVKADGSPVAATANPPTTSDVEPPRYALVVLPFITLDGGGKQDSFADALTENLTTDLSHPYERLVISRNLAFRYKGKSVDVKRLRRDLGVRYVVEGTVQHGASRIRVNVQLIGTETGGHLWAERFDKVRGDPLEIQDEIATRVARELVVQLRDAEARRITTERPNKLGAADLTARAYSLLNRGLERKRSAEARRLLEEALSFDERNMLALAGLAFVIVGQQLAGWTPKSTEQARCAAELSERALAVDPRHPLVLGAKAWILVLQGKPAAAIEVARMLAALEPISGYAIMAFAKICAGRAQESIMDAQKSLELGPHDERFVSFNLMSIGKGHLYLGDADRAIAFLERSANENANLDWTYLYLASAYAQLDRIPEAADAMGSALALSSDWTLRKVDSLATARVPLARWEKILEGMSKAGLPK